MDDVGVSQGILIAWVLVMLGCLLVGSTRSHRQTLRFQWQLFLLAFGIRFAAAIVLYVFGLAQVIRDEDAGAWTNGVDYQARWAAQGVGILELPSALAEAYLRRHKGYYYLVAAFIQLTGSPYRLPVAALNCFFGALTVVLVYRTASLLFSQWVARRVGWWTCLLPSLIIWSAQTLKEPVVILLETVALYACVRIHQRGATPRHLVLCAAAILLVIPFRFYAAYIGAFAVLLALLLPGITRLRTSGAALALAALFIPLVLGGRLTAQYQEPIRDFDLQYVEKYRTAVSSKALSSAAETGVDSGYDMQTPRGFVLGTAVGAAHLLLAPFPWQLGSGNMRMLLTLPELVVWWWLVFAGLLPGLAYTLRHRFKDLLVLFLFLAAFGLLYSMMFGNVGLIVRRRAQLMPWLLIVAVAGLEQHALKKQRIREAQIQQWTRKLDLPALRKPCPLRKPHNHASKFDEA